MNINKHVVCKALLVCSLSCLSFLTNAQEIEATDTLYAQGSSEYNKFLRKSLRYPRESKRNQTEGLLIYEISVNREGQVTVRFMTKVDDYIEKMVIPIIQASSDNWVKQADDYKVYQAIFFTLGHQYAKELQEEVPGFLKKFKFPYLGSAVVTGISSLIGYGGTSTSLYNTKDGAKLKAYNKLKRSLEKHLEKGKTQKAYKTISSIIRYNPFDKSLIQQRRRLEKELGKDEYRVYDILWLQAMDYIASVQNKKP